MVPPLGSTRRNSRNSSRRPAPHAQAALHLPPLGPPEPCKLGAQRCRKLAPRPSLPAWACAAPKRLLGQDVPRLGPHPEPSPSFSLRFVRSLATARSLPGSPSLPALACGASRWHTRSTAQPALPGPTLRSITCYSSQPALIAVSTGPGLRSLKMAYVVDSSASPARPYASLDRLPQHAARPDRRPYRPGSALRQNHYSDRTCLDRVHTPGRPRASAWYNVAGPV